MFSLLAVFNGEIDAFIITGGVIKSNYIKEKLQIKLGSKFKIIIFEGEYEMETLAERVNDVLIHKGTPKEY